MKTSRFNKSQYAILLLSVLLLAASSALAQNPVPSISTPLFPETLAPGGPSFVLTVNGSGFVSSSVVEWNGAALPTTFVSNGQLKAVVPSADIASPGTAFVTVSSGGVISNIAYFEITNATTSLSFNENLYAVGSTPVSIAVGDFNGDGRLDLAVADQGGTLSILLGNGEGTFQPAVSYAAGARPISVAVGDFNGDGKLDLAVANFNDGTVSILLGNGNGSFTAASGSPITVGSLPFSIAVGDFNGDGNLDLAVANSGDGTVSVLMGNGKGSFTAASGSPFKVGAALFSIVAGDFNGDGNLDLAVASLGNTVSVLLGNGAGSFSVVTPSAVGNGPVFMAVGDFNGDGIRDLAVVNQNDGTVSVLLGNGDGSFGKAASYSVGNDPFAIAVGDLNGDGILDLAVTNLNDNTVSILLGKGDGTFLSQATFPTQTIPAGVAIADFNGDGSMDLAVTNIGSNEVSILLQPTPAPPLSTGDITDVTAGSGLSGGGTSGDVTLNNTGLLSLAAGAGLLSTGGQSPTLTLNTSFTDGRYLQLTGGTLLGGLAAPSFTGSAAGLTNLNPANLVSGTAGINITGNAATATLAAGATNALALGGVGPSGYIQNNSGPVQTANLDISGNAGIGGNASVTGNIATTGTLTVGTTGTPITEHISILVNPSFAALKSGSCGHANFALGGAADGDTIALGVPNERMSTTATMVYTAWVSAANTVTVQACDLMGTEKTAGTGSIRIDLWKH